MQSPKRKQMKALTVNAWRFSVDASDGTKWDQVAKLGSFDQGGEPAVFDLTTCSEMLKNFSKQKNKIGMDYEHQAINAPKNGQPAPALAWYNALMLVHAGKIVECVTQDPNISYPDVSGHDDGVYAHRCEVTPLGKQLLPNYKYISPAFVTNGKDEQGKSIGYALINIACTNIPFLDGMEPISFHRLGGGLATATQERTITMAAEDKKDEAAEAKAAEKKELMARLGMAEGAGEDEMYAMLKKYADAEDEAKKAKEAEAEKMSKDAEEGAEEEKKMAEDCDEAKAMRKDLGLPEDAPIATVRAAIYAKTAPIAEVAKLRQELDSLKAEQAAALAKAEDDKIGRFVDGAVADGQWDAAKKEHLAKFAKVDFEAAKASLLPKGAFGVMHRMTAGGAPVGTARTESKIEGLREARGYGEAFAEAAKTYSKEHKVDLATAQRAVAQEQPELAKAYFNQE